MRPGLAVTISAVSATSAFFSATSASCSLIETASFLGKGSAMFRALINDAKSAVGAPIVKYLARASVAVGATRCHSRQVIIAPLQLVCVH